MPLFTSSRGIERSERGNKLSFHAKILIWFLLILLCSCKLALHSQSLIPQVISVCQMLAPSPSQKGSVSSSWIPNFKQSSAHYWFPIYTTLSLVGVPLLALLLSVEDSQLGFSSSFCFLLLILWHIFSLISFLLSLTFPPNIHIELATCYSALTLSGQL